MLPDTAALTEKSSHHEFAWEFLRRNRYYQALCDQRRGHISANEWGYRWHKSVPRTHGLVRPKPYGETYNQGTPPAWLGLDGFAEDLPEAVSLKAKQIDTVELRPGQVMVVFDIGGLLYGQSPWEAQVWALRERLAELAKAPFGEKSLVGKPPHRKVLLRQLRLFDLIDRGASIQGAASQLHYRRPRSADALAALAHQVTLGATDIVTLRGYEDASRAYDLVYGHRYMDLLRGEKDYMLMGKQLMPAGIYFGEEEGN